jgi:2-haloacid dehalogenase
LTQKVRSVACLNGFFDMTSSEPIVVFDIGNVLVEWEPRHLYQKIFGDPVQADWFVSNICTLEWNLEQDRGRSWADGVAILTARHPEWAKEIALYDSRWLETVVGPIAQSMSAFAALKSRGRPVYGLSNISLDKFEIVADVYPMLRQFDGLLRSAEVGLLKPDPAIYEAFLGRFELDASDCVFIDDSVANIVAAREIGMATIQFTQATDLRMELASYGVSLDAS